MSDALQDPPIAPEGYKLVPLRPNLTATVAFRVTPDERIMLEALRDSLPGAKTSDAIRWMLHNPAIRAEIKRQIDSASA